MDRTTRLAGALLAVGALLASSCGDDDGDDEGGSASGTQSEDGGSAAAADGGPEVRILVIGNSAGADPLVNLDSMVAGAEAAAADIDEVALEVESCDPQGDPNQASACARRAVEEGFDAVVALTATQGATILPVLEDGGVPTFWAATIAGQEDVSPISMLPTSPNLSLFGGLGAVPSLLELEDATIITADMAEAVTALVSSSLEATGVNEAGQVSVPFAPAGSGQVPDVAPHAASVAAQDPGVVLLAAASANYVRPLREAGVDVPLILSDSGDPVANETLDELPADLTEDVYRVGPKPAFDTAEPTPALQDFIDAVGSGDPEHEDVTPYAWNTWVGLHALAEVAATMDEVDAASLLDALNSASDIELVTGETWTPGDEGPEGYTRDSNPHAWLYSYAGEGQWEPAGPGPDGFAVDVAWFG